MGETERHRETERETVWERESEQASERNREKGGRQRERKGERGGGGWGGGGGGRQSLDCAKSSPFLTPVTSFQIHPVSTTLFVLNICFIMTPYDHNARRQ